MKPLIKATALTLLCLHLVHLDLMAFAWKEAKGYRFAELPASKTGQPGFTSLPAETTGISFTNWLAQDRHLTNQILLNGSGVAAGDVDGDGWCDLYFCGLDGPNQLYRNQGNWKFQDITASAGVAFTNLDATGAVLADLDGDGDLDLLLNSSGEGTHVYLNDGKAHFTESPANQGLNAKMGGMSLALADMDGDGDLDVYVANYRTVTIRDQPNTRFTFGMSNGTPVLTKIDGRPITEPDLANRFNYKVTLGDKGATFAHDENGEPDVLYRNDRGRLTPVSFTDGSFLDEDGKPLAKPLFDWGLSAMFRDLNGDGAPDIYVCNDFKSPDRLWINDGKGKFHATARLALRQTSLSSMGVDVADVNRDGHDDILVVDMLSRVHSRRQAQRIDIKPEAMSIGQIDNRPQYPRNTLFLGRGDGTFAEVAQLSGLEASEWSWTPVFLDVDLDGYEDLLISNGFERDGMNVDILRRLEAMKKEKKLSTLEQLHLRKIFPRLDTPNLAFRNLGNLKFQDRSAEWGFNAPGISHGMALADLDHDGDLDVAVNNLNSAAGIYRNDCPGSRLTVRLKGQPPNTHGIGARIKVSGGPVAQSQEIVSGGRYLSCDDAMRVFAAGAGEMSIEVTWRSGQRSIVNGVKPNHIYEIEEVAVLSSPLSVAAPSRRLTTDNGQRTTLFTDVSALLGHTHRDEPFEDFARQPLLPNRLSQAGPGVAWFDLNGDGWDDLLIGSGRGGQLAAYRNDGQGGFKRMEDAPFNQPVTRDQTAVLGWRKSDGRTIVLAGSANYEDGLAAGSVARQYDLTAKVVEDALPGQMSSTGPLAMADIDGDDDLDLFVGGRVVPGRYAEPASSLLFRHATGNWTVDTENTKRLANLGLVSGSVFSDIDGDGDPDLITACEWGSLKIFRNEAGKFAPWDPPVTLVPSSSALNPQPSTLNQFTGWWNGVTTGDFDGDGRLDIVAANWGQNSRFESFRGRPLKLFYGDMDGDGTIDVLESYADAQTKRLWPLQPFHLISAALPSIAERLGDYATYASKDLSEIYDPGLKRMKELSAIWLESTLFLNRGDHFEAKPLPIEAQMSPAFAVCVGDMNGDGHEDVFLSQNFFATQPDTSRYDAGRGLWLKGDGQGGFQALPGQDSGVKVYGEQRGAALCDYDGDGRVDLTVTQNGAETKLYKNVGAAPGLRIRLKGPAANPFAVGASIRLINAKKTGPAREIHAGAGYWSQDGAMQVMAVPAGAAQIWIRWPGGKTTTSDLPLDAREVSVDTDGKIQPLR